MPAEHEGSDSLGSSGEARMATVVFSPEQTEQMWAVARQELGVRLRRTGPLLPYGASSPFQSLYPWMVQQRVTMLGWTWPGGVVLDSKITAVRARRGLCELR